MTTPHSKYFGNFRLNTHTEDPEIKFAIPPEALKDLVKRSQENGRSIEVEIALRLARSLEDVDLLDSDMAAAKEKRIQESKQKPKSRRSGSLKN